MEQFEQIRRDREREGLSLHALAERHGVHRRTVRAALASPLAPTKRRPASRPAPKLGAYRELIDGWLIADVDAPRKQRHTSRRIWRRLVDEHGADVAETTVRDHVRKRRSAIMCASVAASSATRRATCSWRSQRARGHRRGRLGAGRRPSSPAANATCCAPSSCPNPRASPAWTPRRPGRPGHLTHRAATRPPFLASKRHRRSVPGGLDTRPDGARTHVPPAKPHYPTIRALLRHVSCGTQGQRQSTLGQLQPPPTRM